MPKLKSQMTENELFKIYHDMVLIREFEERTAEMYTRGKITGFCHLYIGEEAVAVGAMSALHNEDYVISSYRDHGHVLSRELIPTKLWLSFSVGLREHVRVKAGQCIFLILRQTFLGDMPLLPEEYQ